MRASAALRLVRYLNWRTRIIAAYRAAPAAQSAPGASFRSDLYAFAPRGAFRALAAGLAAVNRQRLLTPRRHSAGLRIIINSRRCAGAQRHGTPFNAVANAWLARLPALRGTSNCGAHLLKRRRRHLRCGDAAAPAPVAACVPYAQQAYQRLFAQRWCSAASRVPRHICARRRRQQHRGDAYGGDRNVGGGWLYVSRVRCVPHRNAALRSGSIANVHLWRNVAGCMFVCCISIFAAWRHHQRGALNGSARRRAAWNMRPRCMATRLCVASALSSGCVCAYFCVAHARVATRDAAGADRCLKIVAAARAAYQRFALARRKYGWNGGAPQRQTRYCQNGRRHCRRVARTANARRVKRAAALVSPRTRAACVITPPAAPRLAHAPAQDGMEFSPRPPLFPLRRHSAWQRWRCRTRRWFSSFGTARSPAAGGALARWRWPLRAASSLFSDDSETVALAVCAARGIAYSSLCERWFGCAVRVRRAAVLIFANAGDALSSAALRAQCCGGNVPSRYQRTSPCLFMRRLPRTRIGNRRR